MGQSSHIDLIVDQFTRQATPFSTASPITDAAALKLIVETSGAKATDTVLDVACGGGVVACAFASRVKHVTGIDMTPAMLARSAEYAKKLGLTNLTWRQGRCSPRYRSRMAHFRLYSLASRSITFLIRSRC